MPVRRDSYCGQPGGDATALDRFKIVSAIGQLSASHTQLGIAAAISDTLTDPIAAGLDAVILIRYPRDPQLMIRIPRT